MNPHKTTAPPRHTYSAPPAAHGIAIGRAHLLAPAQTAIPRYWLCAHTVTKECQRLRHALTHSRAQLTEIRETFVHEGERESQGILEAHVLLLADEQFAEQTLSLIRERRINAEWALEKTVARLTHTFLQLGDEYLQQRRYDIEYVGRRVLRILQGRADSAQIAAPYKSTILFAPDLSPAEVVTLPRATIRGFVTTRGGIASHTAIIARSLEMPAIIGNRDVYAQIREGDAVILDADQGVLIVHPTAKELSQYRKRQQQALTLQHTYEQERNLPAVLTDRQRVQLGANIELLEEVPTALTHGAECVGMYRTEYLFMNRTNLPTEEEQLQQYRAVLQQMKDRPVTIRTLDLGGDKLAEVIGHLQEANPALGLRSIRFCLHEIPLFRTQLRALYRASVAGQLRLLIPMISAVEELQAVQSLIRQVQQELQQEGHPIDATIPVGIMIEVPSAVMLADHLARQASFFCIGTNDLTQYTLAVDRTNEQVAHLYHACHPAVLRLIHHTITAAARHRCPVTVCGEMAGEVVGAVLLIGLGVTALSMNSIAIPRIKRLIRGCSYNDAKQVAGRALQATTSPAVERLVQEYLGKLPHSPLDTLGPIP